MTFEEILNEESVIHKLGKFAVNKISDNLNKDYNELIHKYYKVLPSRTKKLFDAHMNNYRKFLLSKHNTTEEEVKRNPVLFHKIQSEYFDEALRRISRDYGDFIDLKMSKFKNILNLSVIKE